MHNFNIQEREREIERDVGCVQFMISEFNVQERDS